MKDEVVSEAISFGHALFSARGEKLAVVTTSHYAGLIRNGVGVCEPYPRTAWTLQWTKPLMRVDEARAVLDLVATLPLHPPVL